MRTIKFRAFYKNKMWDVNTMEFTYSEKPFIDLIDENLEHEGVLQRKVKLMQFTGLKDKNGKEIYEGDILKHYKVDDFDLEEPIIGEVVFDSNGVSAGHWPLGFTNTCEVIGNIFSNPELIK